MSVVQDTIPFASRVNADGNEQVYVKAHAALIAKTPYYLIADEDGYLSQAIGTDALPHRVCVPEVAVPSGEYAWMTVKGLVEGMVVPSMSLTTGHALGITAGAVVDVGADYAGEVTSFAIATADTTAATTANVRLLGELVTAAAA